MKKLILALIGLAVLSGCVVYDRPYYHDHDWHYHHDRDRDWR